MFFFHLNGNYCWWKKSCTSWYGKYPITCRVLTISGGAGFLPSTVVCVVFFWLECLCFGQAWIFNMDATNMDDPGYVMMSFRGGINGESLGLHDSKVATKKIPKKTGWCVCCQRNGNTPTLLSPKDAGEAVLISQKQSVWETCLEKKEHLWPIVSQWQWRCLRYCMCILKKHVKICPIHFGSRHPDFPELPVIDYDPRWFQRDVPVWSVCVLVVGPDSGFICSKKMRSCFHLRFINPNDYVNVSYINLEAMRQVTSQSSWKFGTSCVGCHFQWVMRQDCIVVLIPMLCLGVTLGVWSSVRESIETVEHGIVTSRDHWHWHHHSIAIYIYTLYLWYICACLCFCILFYLHTVEIVLFRLYVL